MKGILGENSPEWEALRSVMRNKVSAPGSGNPRALAASMEYLSKSPVGKTLFNEEQLAGMQELSTALKGMRFEGDETAFERVKEIIGKYLPLEGGAAGFGGGLIEGHMHGMT